LYFRGNTRVDAGGRFAEGSVPDYIVFEGEDKTKLFIETVENGLKNSLKFKKSDKEYEEYKKEVEKEKEVKSQNAKESITLADTYGKYSREEGIEFIKNNYDNNSFKNKVTEVLAERGVKKLIEFNQDEIMRIIKFGVEELGLSL